MSNTSNTPTSSLAAIGKQMVRETLESGITPLTFDYQNVVFFGKETGILRTTMVLHSPDVGTLTYREYRFVARRTRPGLHMVKRHVEKLLRLIPKVTEQYPNIECFTVPVFPRMIRDGELIRILYDAFAMSPAVHPSQVCIEVSADILYEDTETVRARLEEIRELGVKVAINEVGDEYCPFFKLSSLPFDMIFLDGYATDILESYEAEQVMGGLIQYLKSFGVPVIAPELETDAQLAAAKLLECDGYSLSPTATIYEDETEEEEAEEAEEEPTEEAEEEAPAEEAAEETEEEPTEEAEEEVPAEETEATEATEATEETPVEGDVLDAPPIEETEEPPAETPVGGGAFDAPPAEETAETAAETAATEFTDADSPVDQVTGEEEINE